MTKQLTGKRDDTAMHAAARAGQLIAMREMLSGKDAEELAAVLSRQNQAGETPLFVAAEYGYVALVAEMIKYHDVATASIKARSGYDALHIAAKQGDVDVVRELLQALPQLSMTVDASNTTALNTAATQGHMEVVRLLLQVDGSLALIARSNGKTALHSAARNGHVEVVRALVEAEPSIALRTDKKGQTALHMAAKSTRLDLVDALLAAEPALLNQPDTKENTALHIAARKARPEIIKRLLAMPDANLNAINRSRETALDTAEKMGNTEVAELLAEHGVQSARAINPGGGGGKQARELKQQVSDIKHEVHSQLEQTRQTRVRMQGIAKRINKLHEEGLNNAINSTTVVAVLIATVAFAAIFTVPGEYEQDPGSLAPGQQLGEANISHQTAFIIFFVFDSVSLFISLAVVVVQTSVVVIERKAKKQMMAVINKLMWVACVLISVSFLALSFVVVGRAERWLAVSVTIMGGTILVTTIGTMLYWVIAHRVEAKRMRTSKRASLSRSRTFSNSGMSESEWVEEDYKRMYAI
ncbi:hypothetical protein PVAP13_9KG486100 [Panicum virgatum]|uniref:PGG domain-containing protein n=2 Tax=Panicum virgatum TaxID=38727 RepID=A0A8T0NVH2_PANVG|nr:hypothetical protein PVAP13_9KG486100 [Panicum virgatum]KAG2552819.1 hypothetical protein PVAP13_9KG486100 [Panicum virgatum]KAG2552821.1 hypothetical protein PVAP13_9KG486100 [Panicum virgatum]